MEKVLGQCHAEEKCHLSQNAMGKAKEDQMAPTKASLSANKYADSFLLYVRDFSGAANKAYADMARRTLRIKEGPKGRIKLKKNATKVLRQAVESLKIDSSDFRKWHEKSCDALIACYGGQLSYGQAQKWLNMLLKYLYVYDVKGYEALFTEERIRTMDLPVDTTVIKKLRKYGVNPPAIGWSKWDKGTYCAYQTSARDALWSAADIENPDERIPFYWELIHWSDASEA